MAKFFIDQHFIYITTHRDERKEELKSYYKLTNKDMEVMAPTLASRLVEQGFLEHAYLRDNLLLSSVNSDAYNDKDSRTLAGYDKDGVVYCPTIDKSGINATAWLVPAR